MEQKNENSFSDKEQLNFYKKKWIKNNAFGIFLYVFFWIAFIIGLKLLEVNVYVITIVSILSAVLIYMEEYRQMMIYVNDKINK